MAASIFLGACSASPRPETARLESNADVQDMPAYDTLLDRARNLEEAGADVQVIEYGTSVKGRPLTLVKIGKGVAGGSAILMSEATHGNEYLGVGHELLPWLVEQARSGKNPFFARGGVALVVPVVNPDGYEYHRETPEGQRAAEGGPDGGNSWGRMNAHRVDLNRDFRVKGAGFEGFTQPESKALAEGVDKALGGAKLQVAVDYHCCIGAGALLYSYAFTSSKRLPAADEKRVRLYGGFLQQQFPGSELDTSPALAGYDAVGITSDYYYETYGTAAIVYEGMHGGESQRVDAHERGWSGILTDLAKGLPEGPATQTDDVKIALLEKAEGLSFAVAAANAKSIKVCAGATCVPLGKSMQRGAVKIAYDDAVLATPADGVITAVVEREGAKASETKFKVAKK